VFGHRLVRRIFGLKRDEVMRDWRKLHNEELHNLYSSTSILRMINSRRMRWPGHVARIGEKRNAYRILVVKPGGKRPLGRPRRRCVDNIKMYLRQIRWDRMDWIEVARESGPMGGSSEHGNEPSVPVKCWEVLEWLHNWRLLEKG
jgi:hypothetical protein